MSHRNIFLHFDQESIDTVNEAISGKESESKKELTFYHQIQGIEDIKFFQLRENNVIEFPFGYWLSADPLRFIALLFDEIRKTPHGTTFLSLRGIESKIIETNN